MLFIMSSCYDCDKMPFNVVSSAVGRKKNTKMPSSRRAYSNRAPAPAAPQVVYVKAPRKRVSSKRSSGTMVPRNQSTTDQGPGGFAGVGQSIGRTLGGLAGGWLGRITGLGSYKVNQNTLTQDPPTLSNTNAGTRIRHREYITDILSSQAFKTQVTLDLNPGLWLSFPWLSGLAAQYTQYKFHGLLFEYIATSGSAIASTNNALGEVMMATNYNAVDSGFANKQEMLNEEFSTSAMPAVNSIHPIECAPNQTTIPILYTRYTNVAAGVDQRLYDLGVFSLATQGMQADNITVGELYCTYDVEFFKPQLVDNTGLNTYSAHYQLNSVASATPLGNTAATQKFDSIGISVNTGSTSTVVIPAGYTTSFLVQLVVTGSSTSCTPQTLALANASFLNIYQGSAAHTVGGSGTNTVFNQCWAVDAINSQLPVTLSFNTSTAVFPTAISSADLVITVINDGLIN